MKFQIQNVKNICGTFNVFHEMLFCFTRMYLFIEFLALDFFYL